MPLTDTTICNVKPTDKLQKLFDGNGLFLFVASGGTKSWRWKYRFQGREKLLTFGVYPQLSLKEARAACADAKKMLSGGIDPAMQKKSLRASERTPLRPLRENGTTTKSPPGVNATLRMCLNA